MAKRSDFDRKDKDFYVTPIDAAWYLFDKNHTGQTEFVGR